MILINISLFSFILPLAIAFIHFSIKACTVGSRCQLELVVPLYEPYMAFCEWDLDRKGNSPAISRPNGTEHRQKMSSMKAIRTMVSDRHRAERDREIIAQIICTVCFTPPPKVLLAFLSVSPLWSVSCGLEDYSSSFCCHKHSFCSSVFYFFLDTSEPIMLGTFS